MGVCSFVDLPPKLLPPTDNDRECFSSIAELRISVCSLGLLKNMKVAAEMWVCAVFVQKDRSTKDLPFHAGTSCSEQLGTLGFTSRVELFRNRSPQLSEYLIHDYLENSALGALPRDAQWINCKSGIKSSLVGGFVLCFPTLPFTELHKDMLHFVFICEVLLRSALGLFWELAKQLIHRFPKQNNRLPDREIQWFNSKRKHICGCYLTYLIF